MKDFGPWELGARTVLRFIADAADGERSSPVKDLFVWKAVQHIGVAAANAVVKAHDANVLLMRDKALEVLLARYGQRRARERQTGTGPSPGTRHPPAPSFLGVLPPPHDAGFRSGEVRPVQIVDLHICL